MDEVEKTSLAPKQGENLPVCSGDVEEEDVLKILGDMNDSEEKKESREGEVENVGYDAYISDDVVK